VAASPARCVLVYGETGTGKGLVARMLHDRSSRAQKAFVDINCAAIPSSLVESELFGHERGAFTGAAIRKTGLIEAANGGTVFLDEIHETEATVQTKLLSLIDTQSFRRIGSTESTNVDVRFIGAANKILLSEVKAGRFREDLYYRLQIVGINLPPLRERGDDILLLTDHFIRVMNLRYDRTISGLSAESDAIFREYRWPGNVRELENLLERFFILEDENVIRPHHLPARIQRSIGEYRALGVASPDAPVAVAGSAIVETPPGATFYEATQAFQRQLIDNALARNGGSITGAAQSLGISRHALRHQLAKLRFR
jgi:two-component system, NtrC family, response regulator AtoC